MEKRKLIKRAVAAALAAVMALSLTAPALAASFPYPGVTGGTTRIRGTLPGYVTMSVNYDDGPAPISEPKYKPPYKVIINPDSYIATPSATDDAYSSLIATRFHAYQIFAGSLVDDQNYPSYPSGGTNGMVSIDDRWEGAPGMLNGIRWGKSVSGEETIRAVLNALTGTDAEVLLSNVEITANDLLNYGDRYANVSGEKDTLDAAVISDKPADPGPGDDTNYWTWDPDGGEEEEQGAWVLKQDAYDNALKAAITKNFSKYTLADLFLAALEFAGYKKDSNWSAYDSLSGTAKIVAQVLSDFTPENGNNNKLARAFARILYDANCLGAAEDTSYWDATNKQWVIGNDANNTLSGGYYLIVDRYNNNPATNDTTLSDFMVGVYGNITMYAKTEPPKVKKKITADSYDPLDPKNTGGDAGADQKMVEIGDEITFEITGTLPPNFGNYEEYKLQFVDTMGDGLSYVENTIQIYARVRVQNPEYREDPRIANSGAADERSAVQKVEYLDFRINITALKGISGSGLSVTTGQTLTITFNDLKTLNFGALGELSEAVKENIAKQLKAEGGSLADNDISVDMVTRIVGQLKPAEFKVWSGSEFIITYKAILDKDADPGANLNEVQLEYSSDPKDPDTTTKTTPDTVYVYTLGLDLLKYDGSKDTDVVVPGAGFSLSKTVGAGTQYALYAPDSDTPAVWVSAEELEYYLGANFARIDWSNLTGAELPLDPPQEDILVSAAGLKLREIAAKLLENPNYNNIGNVIPSAFSELVLIPTGKAEPTTREWAANTTYHAIVAKRSLDGEYTLAGWISDEDLLELYQRVETTRTDIDGWDTGADADFDEEAWNYFATTGVTGDYVEDYLNPEYSRTDRYYVTMMVGAENSGNDGKLLIVGLDQTYEYVLKERVVPPGYDGLKGDISVEFSDPEYYTEEEATAANKEAGEMKSMKAKVTYDGSDNAVSVTNGGAPQGDDTYTISPASSTVSLQMNIANYPDSYLPGTGGMGTYLFYIGGGALLAGAALLLILTNSKSGKRAEKRGQR